MREIKFRALSALSDKERFGKNNCLIEFTLFEIGNIDEEADIIYVDGTPCLMSSIQQYTGLKDKNGKEIYEGDILKSGDDVMVVEWHVSKATFCLQKDGWLYAHFFEEAVDADKCEVIGNIYEHKHLLEVGDA